MYKNCSFYFNQSIFYNYKKRIQIFQGHSERLLAQNKNFFFWLFRVIYFNKFSALKIKSIEKNYVSGLRFRRRVAPALNLRLYSLYAAILKHGHAVRAKNIIMKVIVLLTENCIEKSGCKVLNNVLRFLEPSVGLLKYRRGRNFYQMPVPLWPHRKKFLAAKFLVQGALQRQRLYHSSFIVALFHEILDVNARKVDTFTLKILKKYRKNIIKVEDQAWRAKKRKY